MDDLTSWCRGCDSLCGLMVRVRDGRLLEVRGDPEHPLSRGHICDHGRGAPAAIGSSERIVTVQRRGEGGLVPAHWNEAFETLSAEISSLVATRGPSSVAVLVGGPAARGQRTARSLASLRARFGPISVLSPLGRLEQPFAHAARHVLGRAETLRADLERAHHVLVLGEPFDAGWPMGQAGQALRQRLARPGRGRRLELCVADPRAGRLAAEATDHLPLRPGTELWLLLGMASAMVRSGWVHRAALDEHSRGLERLAEALAPFEPARVAPLCGLDVAGITAEAMRFSRAPMATVLVSPQALGTPWSTLTAWAVLLLHALTDNLLRPGGLFCHPGAMVAAPAVPVRADTELASSLRALELLICIDADPIGALPGGAGLGAGLGPRLVCIDRRLHRTAQAASWVLPTTHHLEEADLGYGLASPRHWLQWTPALASAPGDCLAPWQILDAITAAGRDHDAVRIHLEAERAGLAQAAMGGHRDLEGRVAAGSLHRSTDERGFDGGPLDRGRWAVSHPDGRLQLAPVPLVQALERLRPPNTDPRFPCALRSSALREPGQGGERGDAGEPRVWLHPSLGFPQGGLVRIVTAHGRCEARVTLDPALRPDVVDLATDQQGRAAALVEPTHLDSWAGTAWTDGQPCRVEPSSAPNPRA